MLKGIRKEFNKLIGKEENVTMAQPIEQAVQPQAAVEETTAQLDAGAFAAQAEQLKVALNALEQANTKLASVQAEFNSLLASNEAAKNAVRLSAIKAAVGDTKAQAVFEATKALADTEFNAIVGAMAGSFTAEAATPLFKEVGAGAEADLTKLPQEESREMQLLQQKYAK